MQDSHAEPPTKKQKRAANHLNSMQSSELEAGERAPTAFESLESFMQIQAGETLRALAFSQPGVSPSMEGVPEILLDRILRPDEAAPHMNSWSLLGGFGNPKSYAMTAWTNHRVIWVTQYDGSTSLDSAPLRPPLFAQPFRCRMPGGS